jgi:hypothetical protein
MRIFTFLFICLLSNATINAQSLTKFSIGASVSGLATGTLLSSSSNEPMKGGKTYQEYTDSVKSLSTFRTSLGIGFWAHAFLTKRLFLQAGVSYLDVGFQRVQSNIKYLDPLYPGIGSKGKLLELSSGSGEKSITYNFRYQYLQIPVMAEYEVYHTKDFFYKISLNAGFGMNILLKHQITANLSQFVVDGKNQYNLDSTGYTAKPVTFNFILGAKGEYRMDKKTIVYVMPLIGFFPMSVSSNQISSYPYYVQVHAGLQYAFSLKEEKKR